MKMIEDHTLACPHCFANTPKPVSIKSFSPSYIGVEFSCPECGAVFTLEIEAREKETGIGWCLLHGPHQRKSAHGR